MTNPRLSLAQSLAAVLTPPESALASEMWFEYLNLVRVSGSSNPDQAAGEAQWPTLAASRIDGVWRAFLASRGYNQAEWDVRIVNMPPGTNVLAAGGGGFPLPAGANKYGVTLQPRTRPPM
jgi:hypothetical protein